MLEAELQAIREAALLEKSVMLDYVNSVRSQIDELNNLRAAHHELIAQIELAISAAQSECVELTGLIDAVQSSRFWSLKRWLRRIRARLLQR